MIDLLKIIPAFALTALLLAIVPGQGVAMILRQSIVGGRRAAFLIFLSIQTLLTLRHEYGKFDYNAVAFIPQFVPKDFSLGLGIFILACVQTLVSTLWYTFTARNRSAV